MVQTENYYVKALEWNRSHCKTPWGTFVLTDVAGSGALAYWIPTGSDPVEVEMFRNADGGNRAAVEWCNARHFKNVRSVLGVVPPVVVTEVSTGSSSGWHGSVNGMRI